MSEPVLREETMPNRLTPAPTRVLIQRVEEEIKRLPQVQILPVHIFAEGLYARQIRIPKGVMLTGRVHKKEHLNFLSLGDITVWTEDGVLRLQAPYVLVSRPGTKRIGYAWSEAVWTTVHAWHGSHDIEEVEAALLEPEQLLEVDPKTLLEVNS